MNVFTLSKIIHASSDSQIKLNDKVFKLKYNTINLWLMKKIKTMHICIYFKGNIFYLN